MVLCGPARIAVSVAGVDGALADPLPGLGGALGGASIAIGAVPNPEPHHGQQQCQQHGQQ